MVTLKLDEAEHRICVIGKKESLISWSFTCHPWFDMKCCSETALT